MKTKDSVTKAVLGTIFIFAIVVAGLFIYRNSALRNSLEDQKLKSEMLLSEKLNLDKSISKMNKDLNDLSGKNIQLDKKILETNTRIEEKNKEIKRLIVQNASIKILKKKNAELETLVQQLNKEINGLNNSLANANAENSKLSNQLTASSKTNSGLTSDNSVLKAIISDNYRIEALRGKKEKLTINARRTNKLTVSFDLPNNVSNKVYFKVITPQGKEFSSNDNFAETIITIKENGDRLLASADANMIGNAGTKRVEMTFKPNEKLKSGIYQFNIYNEDRFLGSTQLRLK